LHRPADPDGEAFYLAQVRAGEYKSRILDQILHSEEAKAHSTTIRGLREHLRMLRLCPPSRSSDGGSPPSCFWHGSTNICASFAGSRTT
jgi:hypothetical protein